MNLICINCLWTQRISACHNIGFQRTKTKSPQFSSQTIEFVMPFHPLKILQILLCFLLLTRVSNNLVNSRQNLFITVITLQVFAPLSSLTFLKNRTIQTLRWFSGGTKVTNGQQHRLIWARAPHVWRFSSCWHFFEQLSMQNSSKDLRLIKYQAIGHQGSTMLIGY